MDRPRALRYGYYVLCSFLSKCFFFFLRPSFLPSLRVVAIPPLTHLGKESEGVNDSTDT